MKIHPLSSLAGAGFLGLAMIATGAMQVPGSQRLQQLPTLTAEQAAVLSHMRLVDMPDRSGVPHLTLLIEGINVQIASGDDNHYSPLMAGNLIIGYPHAAPSGSHNFLQGEDSAIDRSNSCMVSGPGSAIVDSLDAFIMGRSGLIRNGRGDAIFGGDGNSMQNLQPA